MFAANDPNLPVFAALAAPFGADEVRTRNQNGRDLQYITARTAMNRLDEAVGPSNWWDRYTPLGDSAVVCELSVRMPDGSVLTRSDAGGFSKTHDPSDVEKSGLSDAFKRAAVKFGVGRYLYGDGVAPSVRAELIRQRRAEREATQAEREATRAEREATRAGRDPGSDDDREPAPEHEPEYREESRPQPSQQPRQRPAGNGSAPRSGKALFAWAKEQGEINGVDVIEIINGWGKLRKLPVRMIQWSDEDVAAAHTEAVEFLAHNGSQTGAAR